MRLDDVNYDFYQADADLESVKKWISSFLSFGTQPDNHPYNGQMFDLCRMTIMNLNSLA